MAPLPIMAASALATDGFSATQSTFMGPPAMATALYKAPLIRFSYHIFKQPLGDRTVLTVCSDFFTF